VLVDLTGGVSELWQVPTKVSNSSGEGCADEDNSFWHLFLKLKTEISHQTMVTAYIRKEVHTQSLLLKKMIITPFSAILGT
jgi:hypothetical protein